MRVRVFSLLLLACGLAWAEAGPRAAGKAGKKAGGVLVVIDHAGKEVKLSAWKFLSGTRRLSWLAPAGKARAAKGEEAGEDEAPAGPEALALREENSTTFEKGILTLVPVTSLKKIDYDAEARTVRVTYLMASAKDSEAGTLTGSTKYTGINKLTLEGEMDLGELGKAALKFQGGTPRSVKSIQFPEPKPVPAPTGRPAVITASDKEKTKHQVSDLRVLYRVGRGQERLSNLLQFKATVKIDLAKLQKLRRVESEDKSGGGYDFEVTLKSGQEHTLTLLTNTNPDDGKPAQLEGLLGRVSGGYKLFPAHTILHVQFDQGDAGEGKKDAQEAK
jgi:hypothetical protein